MHNIILFSLFGFPFVTLDDDKQTKTMHNTKKWADQGKHMIYKTLHRKLKIDQHEPY